MKKAAAGFKQYLVEVWNEVKPKGGKVTWPSKQEVIDSTKVVLVLVLISGVYLGAIDWACQGILKIFTQIVFPQV